MSRSLLFTMLILFVLAACIPQNPGLPANSTVLPVTPTSAVLEEARLLQAEATYLGPLPARTPIFSTSDATPMPACGPSTEILSAPLVRVQGQVLEVRVCYRSQLENFAAFHIYLDIAGSESPGFSVKGLQAEFLVENDILFRYRGSGRDWNWAQVAPVLSFEVEGGEAIWKIPLNALGSTNGKAIVEVTDKSWNAIGWTMPVSFPGE